MNTKVCYTCITGGYDKIPIHKHTDASWDYVLFTDNAELVKMGKVAHWIVRPLEFDKSTNVKNARWHKINAHILFPEYDYSLWLDGNVIVNNKNIFDKLECLIHDDVLISIPLHPQRNCIYQEAQEIIRLHIDTVSTVNKQMRILRRNKYPKNNGLHETNVMFRQHNKIKSMLDLWWSFVSEHSKRDQLSYNYCAWKYGIDTYPLYPNPGTHRTNGDFEMTYVATHNQDKVHTAKGHKLKIFKKVRRPNGRRHVYLFGIKVLSYKKHNTKDTEHLVCKCDKIASQMVRYCGNDRLPILLRDRFYERTGKLPTEELDTLNEKIIWASMFDVTPLKIQCADKYSVREYVASKIGDKYLVKLYGCWSNISEVNFVDLPDKFVFKHSEGSGKVYLVPKKSEINTDEIKNLMRKWELDEFWMLNLEMQYKDSPRKFIAEEFLDTKIEYKLWCFGGKCKFVKIEIMNEFATNGKPVNQTGKYFWPDWSPADFKTTGAEPSHEVLKPAKLDELLKIAEQLAEPFDFVRVDFFETNDGELRFGEMTFSPAAGRVHFVPESKNLEFGKLFKIPPRDKDGFAVR